MLPKRTVYDHPAAFEKPELDSRSRVENPVPEHKKDTIHVVSASPLRKFVELRARQIRNRFGNSFTENEITDVLLLEWLRWKSRPCLPAEVTPCDSSTVVIDEPTNETSSEGLEKEPQLKTTEGRGTKSTSDRKRRNKVPKEPRKAAKKRQRSTQSETNINPVNEIALAWNKTFQQVSLGTRAAATLIPISIWCYIMYYSIAAIL